MSLCTETSTSISWTKYEDDISIASISSAADSGVFVKTGRSCEITMKLDCHEHRPISRYAEAGDVACDLCQERKLIVYKSSNVVWDPASAHYALILSDDGKKEKLGEKKVALLDTQKFDKWECVLGTEGFSSGRHCWEVEVNSEFIIGVTSQAAQWKGKFSFYPSKGFWCLCHYRQSFTALEELTKGLRTETLPRVLGVCIDVDEKWVTFYNTETKAHIYTFRPMSFADQEQIYPIFSTLVNQETTQPRGGKLPS
ncbi:hypothetical protein SRHO_G00329220 [Serrasalmus rhombeus]